jgi:hypothetical protein
LPSLDNLPERAGVPIIVSSKFLKIDFFHRTLPLFASILNKIPELFNKNKYSDK